MASAAKLDLPQEQKKLEESKHNLAAARAEYDVITAKKKDIFSETLSVMTLIDKEMKLIKAAENELVTNKAKQAQIKGNYDKFVAALNEVNANMTTTLTESNKIATSLSENKTILEEKKQQLEKVKNEQYQILYETAKINKDIQVLKEQIEKEKNESKASNQTIATLNTQIDGLQKTRNVENSKLVALTKIVDEFTKKIDDIRHNKDDMENSITMQKKNIDDINASMITAKKEYDVLVSFKATLNGQIESVKEQHANERLQIKNTERALTDISKVLDKERKIFQDLNAQLQKKNDIVSAGKNAIDDINSKMIVLDQETAKQEAQIKENIAKMNAAKVEKNKEIDDVNAALDTVKKEHDSLVAFRNELSGKIEFTKGLLANERTNIKTSENSLTEMNKLIEREKKTVQEINTKYQINAGILSAGKKTVEDTANKIAVLEEETAKQANQIKDMNDKLNATNAALMSVNKEYAGVVSEKTALNDQIASVKEQLANERSQIKTTERSLADMTRLVDKE